MGDDFGDGGDFGDFGNGGDNGGDDGGYDDQDNQGGDDQDPDDQDNDQPPDDDGNGDGGGNNDDDDQNLDDMFASSDDLPPVDDDVFGSASDFPNADASDFEDDSGDWSAADYQQSAENLFGDHPFFGDTLVQQKIDEGFQPYEDAGFDHGFDQIAPGTSDTLQLFEREGRLVAFGVVSQAVLELLMARYTGIDWNNMEVAVPSERRSGAATAAAARIRQHRRAGRRGSAQVLHACRRSRPDGPLLRVCLDTRRGDVAQYSERKNPRACRPNFTMLEFQRMQGDARDYEYAYEGGDGTISGPGSGRGPSRIRNLPAGTLAG